jgi:uncharacterized protein
MRTRIMLALAAGALVLTACGSTPDVIVQGAGSGEDGTMNGVSVSGTGEVAGAPDTLAVDIGVSVLRDSVSDAITTAADLTTGLIERFSDLGIAEDDLRTANYSIQPEYRWPRDGGEPTITGYRVVNTLTVKIRDIDRAGEVIDSAAEAAGDDVTVSGVRFSIEEDAALIEAARSAAWEDAADKAAQLAGLAGVTLGPAVSINETLSPAPPVVYYDRAVAADEAGASTPIQPGTQSVTVNIQVTFSILP